MVTKISLIAALLALLLLPIAAQAGEEMQFGADSLIIPMDSYYQLEADGGLLEAYGLVFDLLKNDITVYWIINELKTTIDGTDVIIADNTLPNDETGVTDVVKLYDHAGALGNLTYATGDSQTQISYSGAPFVIDAVDAVKAKALIDSPAWSAVEVHEAQVAFSAPVYREMSGTPPHIALMNDSEQRDSGNALKILEPYLRLAGICTDVYDIVTPNDIRDNKLFDSATNTYKYDFLWAPHWAGYEKYPHADVETIVLKVREFLEDSNGLLAECASIEVFEHSANGRFLATKGFGHNGGWNDSAHIIYNDVTSPNAQVGDFSYEPTGGHLHNWRPFKFGDDSGTEPITGKSLDYMKGKMPAPNTWAAPDTVTEGNNSAYNATVSRFTIDTADWDYYVGGYVDGDTNKGYVVYLGGHKYASCGGGGKKKADTTVQYNSHEMKLEFNGDIGAANVSISLFYNNGVVSGWTADIPLLQDGAPVANTTISVDGSAFFKMDLSTGPAVVDGKKIEEVYFENLTANQLSIEKIKVSWTDGSPGSFKKLEDKTAGIKNYDKGSDASGAEVTLTNNVVLDAVATAATGEEPGVTSGCTDNADCTAENIAAVRYILNTLFDIKYQLKSKEYSRAGMVVDRDDYGYIGSFEYPSYVGHFRKIFTGVAMGEPGYEVWNLGDPIQLLIKDADANLIAGATARQVFTATQSGTSWASTSFTTDNLDQLIVDPDPNVSGEEGEKSLRTILTLTPDNGDDSDEEALIHRIRGKVWDESNNTWIENSGNRMGAVEHSVSAIASCVNDYTCYPYEYRDGKMKRVVGAEKRPVVAYVGDLNGMLHAVDVKSGEELWSFIPSNLLHKLQNRRNDANAVQDFAAVDSSPAIADIYMTIAIDHDNDPNTDDIEIEAWRTILTCAEGKGGGAIFAMDITDPTKPQVLWEVIDAVMGYSDRASIGKLEWPVYKLDGFGAIVYEIDDNGLPICQTDMFGEIIYDDSGNCVQVPVVDHYVVRNVAYSATSFPALATEHGGITVFCYDIATGEKIWTFSQEYDTSVNGIPGTVTTFDKNVDSFTDMVFVGDNQGRMWQLNPLDGSNPYGTVADPDNPEIQREVPLHNAGPTRPITHSPAVVNYRNEVLVVFGTGGADWAPKNNSTLHYGVAVSATYQNNPIEYSEGAGRIKWKQVFGLGEGAYSAPAIAIDKVYIATVTGTMDSADPENDVAGNGFIYVLHLDGASSELDPEAAHLLEKMSTGKIRGALYFRNQHLHASDIQGQHINIDESDRVAPPLDPGGNDPGGSSFPVRSWQEM